MKTILHIVGNRPQFIKLAVLHSELAKDTGIVQKIIHTGQHYSSNMSDIFFSELQIPLPDVNFNIQHNSPPIFIGNAAESLYNYFLREQNAVAFTYGDTNTTLAAAMAAKRCSLPLIHFEAGVRTHDNSMPEETNRIITDRLADVNYCCTEFNLQTMQQEGYGDAFPSEALLTGDLMLDAFLKTPSAKTNITDHQKYIVCTIHREANLANRQKLTNIIAALNKIHEHVPVVLPLHPHTKKRLDEYGLTPNFNLLQPLGYADMKALLSGAEYIITDSGGTSREAYFLKKKSLVVMDKPFWPEIMNANCSIQTAAEKDAIITNFHLLPQLQPIFTTNLFGTGSAAENIRKHLTVYLAQ
ncbi:MAG: UDP-N-acetyl glucosamine 2-epimerase [Ferruginibacter sp.]